MRYMTLHVVRHVMADDRLSDAKFYDDGVVVFEYRYGHINPALVQEMGRLSRDVAHSDALDLDLDHEGPPEMMAWLESGNLGDDLMCARVGNGDATLPPFFEIQCRSDHVDPALIRELNEQTFPVVCGLLVPRMNVTSH